MIPVRTRDGRPEVGTAVIDVSDLPETFDFSGAERWHVIVLDSGVPVDAIDLPSPGGSVPRSFLDAVFTARTAHVRARRCLVEDIRRRIGVSDDTEPSDADPTVSVIMCTHGRPQHLTRALKALSDLSPAPSEVVIVDNDPGDADCRAEVERLGFRYVREDRRGLDNARNAGLNASRGEFVAFTDDDCVTVPGWLRNVGRDFKDPSVAGVTGPMFPYRLQTHSQVLMERIAGMSRGFQRQTFDWRSISAVHAGAIGVGANMTFRRGALDELGPAPFPPELDAGTQTESGGDTYVIARIIAAGHRIIYAPEMYGFHDHRPDPASLQKAVQGYGIGISAAMWKLLIENRELEVWRGWWWLVHQHIRMQRRRIGGRESADEVRISRQYISGGLKGRRRWRAARGGANPGSGHPSLVADQEPVRPHGPPDPMGREASNPTISVVIPTNRWGRVLARCLDSLAQQTIPSSDFEIVLVDDRPAHARDDSLQLGENVAIVLSGGSGASAARNAGARAARAPLVLFIDDDMIAASDLLERHLDRHGKQHAIAVVGAYWPRPRNRGLVASAVALWWNDAFESMRSAACPTFVWMLSGNLSVSRELFIEVGGFADDIPYRREDWEFGLRWVKAGNTIAYLPAAETRHEFSLRTTDRLRGAELEGFGDARISQRHPGTAGSLPLVGHRSLRDGSRSRRLGFRILRLSPMERLLLWLLDRLESNHLRGAWLQVLRVAQSSAYKQGLERADWDPRTVAETTVHCDLLSDEALQPQDGVAPTLHVTLHGRELAVVRPHEGFWGSDVATQVADAVGDDAFLELSAARNWMPRTDVPSEMLSREVDVIDICSDDPLQRWSAVAHQLAESDAEIVVLLLSGEPVGNARWICEVGEAFEGQRVAAALGSFDPAPAPARPIYLHDAATPPRFEPGEAIDYVAIRRCSVHDVGGIDPDAARLGVIGPAIDLLQRSLWLGKLVARRDVSGQSRVTGVAARERGRAWAHARARYVPASTGLLVRDLAAIATPLLWDTYKRRGRLQRGLALETMGALEGRIAAARQRLTRGAEQRTNPGGASQTPPSSLHPETATSQQAG